MSREIFAFDGNRRSNGQLVADCAELGYLRADEPTLDVTYGKGLFWSRWAPDDLTVSDLYGEARYLPDRMHRGREVHAWNFTDLPLWERSVGAVVFDPPYKMNGTSTGRGPSAADAGYGVARKATAQQRIEEALLGIDECARVAQRMLLIKCMDQVHSGHVVWQSRLFGERAEERGFRLVDTLYVVGYRKQPESRSQVHVRRNYSVMLVCRRVTP